MRGRSATSALPWGEAVHDETHDSSEVVTMERYLGRLRQVQVTGVVGPLAIPESLYSLAAIGRMELFHANVKTKGNARDNK